MDDLVRRLKRAYVTWNNPPSYGLPDDGEVVLEAAARIEAQAAMLRECVEALEHLAKAVILPSGSIIGLMREDFIAARVAIAKAKREAQ